MASNSDAAIPVNPGHVHGPYVPNVVCPNAACKQLNPTHLTNCLGCGQMLVTNA
jgi:hypothetical protein